MRRTARGEAYVSKLFGTNIQVIATPDGVQAWQTVGFIERTNELAHPEGLEFYQKGGEPVNVPKALAERLSSRLLSFTSYEYDPEGEKACIPMPGFALSFIRGNQTVDVFLCFECDMLNVESGAFKSWGDFDPAHNDLLQSIKLIFPRDSRVQSIPERQR